MESYSGSYEETSQWLELPEFIYWRQSHSH
jgi:hypothetical protein